MLKLDRNKPENDRKNGGNILHFESRAFFTIQSNKS